MTRLQENGSITVGEIIEAFGVSEATARRDLETLEQKKLLVRTFGGAVPQTVRTEIPFYEKMDMNRDEKKEIADKALSLIRDGDVIGLTGGSTNMLIALRMQQRAFKKLTVVTNALNIAVELIGQPNLQLIVTGGISRTQSFELSGPLADASLSQLTIQKSFVGVDGISIERGISTFDELEAQTNRMMMRHSRETYIVADHTKFAGDSIFLISNLDSVSALLTDAQLNPAIRKRFQDNGVKIL